LQKIEVLLSIDYHDYETKVLEFLSAETKAQYSGEESWNEVQERVLALLQ
jgi:hypothetical protein